MPEDVELEPEASSTENDSELSQELLFDDGESDTFNDGNDSSSAAFASSKYRITISGLPIQLRPVLLWMEKYPDEVSV